MATKKIVSAFEPVTFPEFGDLTEYRAKIDTGAYTGAFHCTEIQEIGSGDEKVLHFKPFDNPEVEVTASNFMIRYVKSSNGERQRRYFIETRIVLQGQEYPITLSLADRSEMKSPVLIGRSFLAANGFLVDASRRPRYGGGVEKL